jgi:hypothetical protein
MAAGLRMPNPTAPIDPASVPRPEMPPEAQPSMPAQPLEPPGVPMPPPVDPAATAAGIRSPLPPPPEPGTAAAPFPGASPPEAISTSVPASSPGAVSPGGPSAVSQLWDRIGSVDMALTAGMAVLAVTFGLVGLLLELAADEDSKAMARGEVWQFVSVALAVGAAAWASSARPRLRKPDVLPEGRDRLLLLGLGVLALVFAVIGFARAAGYDLVDDVEDLPDPFFGTFMHYDEKAWQLWAFMWALLAVAWGLLTRPLDGALARRLALILTAVAGFFLAGGLVIGHNGDEPEDAFNGLVRASAWYGLGLVLLTVSAAALFGRREGEA